MMAYLVRQYVAENGRAKNKQIQYTEIMIEILHKRLQLRVKYQTREPATANDHVDATT